MNCLYGIGIVSIIRERHDLEKKTPENERKFPVWEALPGGGRLYIL